LDSLFAGSRKQAQQRETENKTENLSFLSYYFLTASTKSGSPSLLCVCVGEEEKKRREKSLPYPLCSLPVCVNRVVLSSLRS
jgi:hypothetical protein